MPKKNRLEMPSLEEQVNIIAQLKQIGTTQKIVADRFGLKVHIVGKIWRSRNDIEEQQSMEIDSTDLNKDSTSNDRKRVNNDDDVERDLRVCGIQAFDPFLAGEVVEIVPYWVTAQPLAPAPVDQSEQLTSQDVSKIVALLGGSSDADVNFKTAAASLKDETKETKEQQNQSSVVNSLPVPRAILSNTEPDFAQSLSMLNTLVSSGGISPETLRLFGLTTPTSTDATTTTSTENPNVGETQQALALINALLGASGGDNTGAASSSSSDAASLAALLSLASTASSPQQPLPQGTQQQSAADAALLTNLLLSTAAAQGAADPSKLKQQDFQSFQNAGLNLDSASSNQLSGILGLLGTLGSLGSPQPSIFNLGQQQQPNILAGLLGGGGQSQSNNLLGGLLASASGQQAQKPGLLSSLGTLASVVGSSLSQGDGKPRVRGVDTRLGLGYRFGENADAQVVWEIGPQLFTEPLSNEQKQQILLQQQQQLQRRQLHNNANRRVHVIHKTGSPTRQPIRHKKHSPTLVSRRQLAIQKDQVNRHFMEPSQKPFVVYQNAPPGLIQSGRPTTLHRVSQPSPKLYSSSSHVESQPNRHNSNYLRDPENENESNANYYAKKEGNPRVNRDSQLTDYERWLLTNPNRDQIHQQQLLVNTNVQPNRKDSFIFSKDNANNIVRVRIQPRQNPRHVQIYQAVSGMNDVQANGNRVPLTPINKLSHRMGGYDNYDHYNPAADDSYSRRNALVYNPELRELERQRERQQHVQSLQQRRNGNNGDSNRRISTAVASTLSDWSEKNSFFDVMQNYVLTSLQSEGNNLVKNFFHAREQQDRKQQRQSNHSPAPAPSQQHQQSATTGLKTSGIIPSLKGLLGIEKLKQIIKPTVKPVIRVGDDVKYDDLKLMLNGGEQESESKVIPVVHEGAVMTEKGEKTRTPDIFIDIENGEVSMMKPFGSMESFTPPPPEILPEDSPKHVFKVLQEQLKEQYEKVKMEQLREAAKQRRKENLANGLSNPNDPLYLAAKYFELLEKETRK